ncbi:hypothetical protein Tco_0581912 [Tanacetum coccineum]
MRLKDYTLVTSSSEHVYAIDTFGARVCDDVHDLQEECIDIMEIDTCLFCYESPLCLQFKEFNYLLHIGEDLFTHEIVVHVSDEEFLSMKPRMQSDGIPWDTPKEQINRFVEEYTSTKKEILGLNMDADTYETLYCKQLREDELEVMYRVSEEFDGEEEHDIDKPFKSASKHGLSKNDIKYLVRLANSECECDLRSGHANYCNSYNYDMVPKDLDYGKDFGEWDIDDHLVKTGIPYFLDEEKEEFKRRRCHL